MLRKAEIEDSAALSAFINRAYRGDSSRKGWTTEADLLDGTRTDPALLESVINREDSVILILSEEQEILACVELRAEGSGMYLGMLTVNPDRQGEGLGKKMLEDGESYARSIGCKTVHMTVLAPRTELIKWYVRHGYRETGERKPFAFDDPRFGQPKQKLEFVVLEKDL